MIVQCDNCDSRFDVPNAMLMPEGRKLKCANCEKIFFQGPPEPPPIADDLKPQEDFLPPEDLTKLLNPKESGDQTERITPNASEDQLQDLDHNESEEQPQDLDHNEPEDYLHDLDQMESDDPVQDLDQMESDDPVQDLDQMESDNLIQDSDFDPNAYTKLATPEEDDQEESPGFSEDDFLNEDFDEEDFDEEEATVVAQKAGEEWATDPDQLAEIDVDGDPELSELEDVEQELQENGDPIETLFGDNTGLSEDESFFAGDEEPWPDEDEDGEPLVEPSEDADPLLPGMKMPPPLEPEEDESFDFSEEEDVSSIEEDVFDPETMGESFTEEEMDALVPIPTSMPASSKKAWSLSGLLMLMLILSVASLTDWWQYKWYSLKSPFLLSTVQGAWRIHSFGTLLLVEGDLSNNSRLVKSPPMVRISLMDEENNPMTSAKVIPGRVVNEKMLDDSNEESIRTMASLQGSQKKIKSQSVWPGKTLPFQAIFINPPEKAVRFQVDFDSSDVGDQSKNKALHFGNAF